jgi:hypothetical protein
MRTSTKAMGWSAAALGAVALWSGVIVTACAGSGRAQRQAVTAEHPSVDADLETCADCHAQVTPPVVKAWSDGRHGLAQVQCVVCHGSTGADFRARPAAASCQGCHPRILPAAGNGPRGCFACHSPHALRAEGSSPHGGQP